MTSLKVVLARLAETMSPETSDLPEAEISAAPATFEDLAGLLRQASEARLRVLIWGGGTHQGYGGRVTPDLLISTARLDRVTAWEPEDLTLVVEAGAPIDQVEEQLAERGQTAILPPRPHRATVGGVVAAGVSCYRRARYGPTRDRVLEVTLVTGDGRVIKGGGRVVKNVTGYDLPRLAVGSMGALGVVASVCLKLWPLPTAAATVVVDDPERAAAILYRPLAILSTRAETRAYLSGTEAEVEAQVAKLGGESTMGLHWPPALPGAFQFSLRLPPALLKAGLARLPGSWDYLAQHGVGVVETAGRDPGGAGDLRRWAESVGGALVVAHAPEDFYQRLDPWGTPPPTLNLQRRVVAAFDPARILNPGRLPGGV